MRPALRRALPVVLALAATMMLCAAAARPAPWAWRLPAGIAPPPVPADNPMTAAKVALGRRLFYDADLSINGTMSCATCHEQKRGFADGNRTRPGVHGDPGRRNVPGLANIAYIRPLTWADSRIATLEAQVAVPLFGDHPVEMGMKGKEAELAGRFARDRCYRRMFRAAFPETQGRIDVTAVAKALAAFQRSMIALDSPWDRARRGEAASPSVAQRRGEADFRRSCAACHAGDHFTDLRFHAIAATTPDAPDRGLAEATGEAIDSGRFRTPGLRNISLTAPYLHDGSAATLGEAIRRHSGFATLAPDRESDLAAFLDMLTDRTFIADPAFAHPDRACGKRL